MEFLARKKLYEESKRKQSNPKELIPIETPHSAYKDMNTSKDEQEKEDPAMEEVIVATEPLRQWAFIPTLPPFDLPHTLAAASIKIFLAFATYSPQRAKLFGSTESTPPQSTQSMPPQSTQSTPPQSTQSTTSRSLTPARYPSPTTARHPYTIRAPPFANRLSQPHARAPPSANHRAPPIHDTRTTLRQPPLAASASRLAQFSARFILALRSLNGTLPRASKS
ncbi:uncharacterized protein G2W53_001319 [Senna tora]|uniref:Uncharacterized protein n=1 Tax=Senna tora TaxID=362788 RepID=A0A834XHF8_9FABA|nr:uncharacterized protein G2W53_001319 [Senna tora]